MVPAAKHARQQSRYEFVLDLYPILAEFPAEAWLLTMRLEQCAYDLVTSKQPPTKLRLMLRMARDLGYLDERMYFFLEKRVGMV